ncbi:hypothetical protein SERLA73DRAFT_113133 [Serpula lacrymans var. lacrymans S7.3]|uniref:CCAAT-binding factor domain-containing protein n=2 Tax=Serpula lacrymans var. lacrymans TaxID=341189 RepID=F8Q7J6_SERL3|nr:uncharacterized protein SERLADRAFT_363216 [Serpula lacrymans var. lacrymans S7.9]EGN95534.1 hypothetical protein SERLA73DRAFT_113133 [Serpula lacrymans var. lacrymans S7.3]EGO21061.1 hypothetical protein SERLADRAFT_363216 [Serpula lacrymans var. lacrymans S7.9]
MPVRSLPPNKKRKTEKDGLSFEVSSRRLEAQLTSAVASNASLNPLADLLDLANTASDAQDLSKVIYSLYRVFVTIIQSGKLDRGGDEASKVVRKWIWERLDSYVDLLVGLLQDEEIFLRKSSLEILFSLLKHLSTSQTQSSSPPQPQFHTSHFKKIVRGILLCPPSPRPSVKSLYEGRTLSDVRDTFIDTWLSVYDDVRWCFLREATTILAQTTVASHPHLPTNLLAILEQLTTFPTDPSELNSWWVQELGAKPPKPKARNTSGDVVEEDEDMSSNEDDADDWRKFFDEDANAKNSGPIGIKGRMHQLTFHQSLHSLQAHRAVFTRTWLSFLPFLSSESTESYKALTTRALNIMHRGVLPHLTRPVLVMDWVGACVDFGGAVGLLALNALFILMKEYNLDYPSFYTRLYAFLDRDVLHLKHRARFFRMTDLFLSSTHLPATLLASFIKRLARLSLSAPPAAIIMLIPFTYNILKRHPALMVMIHRPEDDESSEHDVFKADEVNPNVTNALESSLWELYSHKRHYDTAVSTLARVFEEAFTKPGYSMEDFLDHTYGTLIETEVKRRIRREPPLAMELRANQFPNGEEEASGEQVDVVSEMWTFG